MFSIKALAALLPLVATINGHMLMKTPIPYGKGSISNGPLDPSGSDFPCKNIFELANGDADINRMSVGSTQTLSFTGSAVHGGGSCQVSLTKDLKPTKNSKWMVIKSIEGSCPAGVDGNLPADPNGSGASSFQYKIPEGIAPGEYTIAWTWVNKIGNREFYMNCGRADIAAAAKKRYAPTEKPVKRQSSFPDLFVANLAGINSCTTQEGIDIQYPDPGADPIISTSSNVKFGPPQGDCGAGNRSGASSGGSDDTAPTGTDSAAPTTTSAGSAPGVFASGAAPAEPATTTTAAPVAPAATTAVVADSPVLGSTPPVVPDVVTPVTTSGDQTPGSPCSPEGQWSCAANGQSFQRCASGAWSAPMAMAAGTACTPGTGASINMTTRSSKRVAFSA